MKVAIYNGYKMTLPYYGKNDSMYGWFTTEGFVTLYDTNNYQNLVINEVDYDCLIEVASEEEYEAIEFPEW